MRQLQVQCLSIPLMHKKAFFQISLTLNLFPYLTVTMCQVGWQENLNLDIAHFLRVEILLVSCRDQNGYALCGLNKQTYGQVNASPKTCYLNSETFIKF